MTFMGKALGTVLLAASLQAQAGERPARFKVGIGGFFGPSYAVELSEKGALVYSRNAKTFVAAEGTVRETVEVSPEAWRTFCRELDEIDVWAWKPRYENPNVMDGTQWQVDIAACGKSIASTGYNDYPGGTLPPDGDRFPRFLRAMSELLGGREFR